MGKMKFVVLGISLIALVVAAFSRNDEEFGSSTSNRTIAVVATVIPDR
ncbi:MAG: hypothetical protein Fur0034_18040 [Desulfuromonadia bacterium]